MNLRILFLAAVGALLASFAASAGESAQSANDLFNETVIIKRIERTPDTSNLSPKELAHLYAAKDLLTEFFRRLNSAHGRPALELLSDSYRANFVSSRQFYRNHFDFEAIVSYRIFDFSFDGDQKQIWFQIFLRESLEGIDYITPREVRLGRSHEAWQIYELR